MLKDMTQFNPSHPFVLAMKNWDEVKRTSECRHCHGTGLAPGDGRTECGFCDARPDTREAAKPRNIVVRQKNGDNSDKPRGVPRDAWYVLNVDTKEMLAWNRSRSKAVEMIPYYETC